MKNTFSSIVLIGFAIFAFTPHTFSQDYTQWGLPEGAKARFGKGTIGKTAYSPDGMRLAVASNIGIWIYDAQTGKELDLLTGHTSDSRYLVFSPDGQTFASHNWESIHLWDVRTGELTRTLTGHTNQIRTIAFSLDGQTLASGNSEGTIQLWNTQTGKHTRTLTAHTSVLTIVFSPDGNMIASGNRDNSIRLWDTNTGEYLHRLIGHTDWVERLSFSPDSRTLASASASAEETIRLWDVDTGAYLRTLTGHRWVTCVAFSPDGRILVSVSPSDDESIRLWDANTGQYLNTLGGNRKFWEVAFSPDGLILASINSEEIDLWDMETQQYLSPLVRHWSITDTSFSPDGETLAGASNHEILLWNTNTGKHLRTLARHQWIKNVTFSPDGLTLASGGWQAIRLWDTSTGELLHTLIGHTHWVDSISFSPDGRTLASASRDHSICLWDPVSGQRKQKLTWHTEASRLAPNELDPAINIAFSPDSKTLASGSSDPDSGEGTIRLWEVASGRNIHTLTEVEKSTHPRWRYITEVTSLAFSPDGRTLVSGDHHTIHFWDVPTGKHLRTLDRDLIGTIVALSPDGQTLANGGHRIGLWNVQTGMHIRTLAGDRTGIDNLSFSPDGQTLASNSWAGTVLLWELTSTSPEPERITEDVNNDDIVNIQDLVLVASNFGKTGQNAADVNNDGVVNIVDLTLIAGAISNAAAAPSVWGRDLEIAPTRKQVEKWLREAQQVNLTDARFQRGILILEQLLASLTPKETALLPNYPNPFNPETWIPYQLAEPADVSIFIYAADGTLVRMLDLGHQAVGIYESRSRAAYWDGRNDVGEPVASGIYFYTLTAGEFTTTRKMLIRK